MINEQLLLKFGAQIKEYSKNELIFSENENARNYFQILKGIVKMNNYNDRGKEFIQGIFYKQQSFGESPLFINVKYPANATAISDTHIYILPKKKLFGLLYEKPEIHLEITRSLAKKLYYKAIIASEISSQEPEHRVLRFFDYLKNDVYKIGGKFTLKIEYTRQQIADILGLRVETIIRVIKNLEKKNELQIIKRKVFR
ncbi:Crp/Fnr family transcriptional regulator [Polaribacter sp. HL-MS24]|uniref:Crp/Fnr family transcriptional regulator n=1 Tax=Polaribacter sp. HL-MS24 TaxID=3077735 RepID=UPI0029345F30|nr:Crp/Fnr family transcriptional regulator [Polaribacter sp. HL-MS24]WOC40361.1 Crp/Fnr family transcriptional regulator [Polaribacter sp. HL-MS24]